MLKSYRLPYFGHSLSKSHTNFDVLLSMHVRVMMWSFGGEAFLNDLDVGACIF